MKRIAIVGAGQSGLQLGLGLLAAGYEVTMFSDRSADEIYHGRVMSSQCLFQSAIEIERTMGLNYWEQECPKVESMSFSVPDLVGGKSIDWCARLDGYAQSVDQRVKIPGWMSEFQKRGGELHIKAAGVDELESCARSHDLVIVASGRKSMDGLFQRDPDRSRYSSPQRMLALTYVRNALPRNADAAISFNLVPNVGEVFTFPALTTSGPCDILVYEGVPGGPMDCWSDITTPAEHLARSREILEKFVPWEAERYKQAELTDAAGTLTGGYAPVVRSPIGTLPSGRKVLGMADAVVLNDPITGQGANNAARCAEIYLDSIVERGEEPADAEWMQRTFDRYWTGYAQWVVCWTNLLLNPPNHVFKIMDCAGKITAVAQAFVNGFDDPRTFFPWFMDPGEASKFLDEEAKLVSERFDRRDLRRALGQFATGVTVVTTRASDGRKVGLTVNSFASVSLNPPLVLWSLSRQAPSCGDFCTASHFAINVLECRQHHLSRQFSSPVPDKFAGVDFVEGTAGVPLLNHTLARFVCRKVRQYDGGDHVIFIGEVEHYEYEDGEPLVFSTGQYRITTRHPDIAD